MSLLLTEHVEELMFFNDLRKLVLGKVLGQGGSRVVYENQLDPNTVIKVQMEQPWDNIAEYRLWQEVRWESNSDIEGKDRDVKLAKNWLAGCISISDNGHFLIMERTRPLDKDRYPTKIPAFLTDTKYRNYGMIGDRFDVKISQRQKTP